MKYKAFIFLLLGLLAVGCASQKEALYDYGTLDVEKTYSSLEEIVEESPLIAKVTYESKTKVINYLDNDFSLSELKIEEVFKGDEKLVNSSVNVLEHSMIDLTKDKGDGQFFLFLKPYEGPIIDDAYVVTGVYQGRFKINEEDGRLIYDAQKYGGHNKFQTEFIQTPIDRIGESLQIQ